MINIEKRIKRHIKAGTHHYFAVVLPGLEDLALEELKNAQIGKDHKRLNGGVEFFGGEEELWKAHLLCRIPTRFLWRIGKAKATGFGELRRKLAALNWELYLPSKGQSPLEIRVQASVHHCRLFMKEQVETEVFKAVTDRFESLDLVPPANPGRGSGISKDSLKDSKKGSSKSNSKGKEKPFLAIMVRGIDDRFEVSIDATGVPLYKRGYRIHTETAPMRETLAAAMLQSAKIKECKILFDPMCGSGALLAEGAGISLGYLSGGRRRFSFEAMPGFRPAAFKHLLKSLKEEAVPFSLKLTGQDLSSKTLATAKSNLESIGVKDAELIHGNFFKTSPRVKNSSDTLICMNPPYGKRLEADIQFYRELGNSLRARHKNCRFVMILPNDPDLLKALALKTKYRLETSNGGIPVLIISGII